VKLYTKVLLCGAAAALIAGEGIIVYSRRIVHAAMLAHVEQSGAAEAGKSSRALAAAMLTRDESRILPVLQAFMKATGGVYAAALDGRGRVLAHSNVAEVGLVYADAETLSALKSDHSTSREISPQRKPVLEM
jgi:hypothetical protein